MDELKWLNFEDMSTKIAGIYVGGDFIYGANRLGEIL